jgi:hypothetical protein
LKGSEKEEERREEFHYGGHREHRDERRRKRKEFTTEGIEEAQREWRIGRKNDGYQRPDIRFREAKRNKQRPATSDQEIRKANPRKEPTLKHRGWGTRRTPRDAKIEEGFLTPRTPFGMTNCGYGK